MKTKLIYIIVILVSISSCSKEGSDKMNIGNNTGKGGSMARFSITNNRLYVVDNTNLNVINISDPINPTFVNSKEIGFGIETIFSRGNNLFLGAQTGMYIYDITNQDNPVQISIYSHITSCDPVVVEDSLAFVTLRSGGTCQFGITENLLDIININDLESPVSLVSYNVDEPFGLGIDNSTLFLCHGTKGLGIYDISNIYDLKTIIKYTDIETYDVIPNNGVLIVVGETGLYQYNYSDLNNITKISEILVGN